MDVLISHGDHWLIFQYGSSGIEYRVMQSKKIERILEHIKTIKELSCFIAVAVDGLPKNRWFPMITNSCNEICRRIAMTDIGWTFNPQHLYTKLWRFTGRRNFRILTAWSRRDGIFWRRQ